MDHYNTLGIQRDATQDEIKKAYRKLAAQHHPDKGGDTATFQKIQVAYDTLSDVEKRKQYDHPNMFTRNNDHDFAGAFGMFNDHFDPREIFAHIFGQKGNPFGTHNTHHQQIFRTSLSVTLEDAYHGKKQILQTQTPMGQKIITIDVPKGIADNSQIRYDNVIEGVILLIEFRVVSNLKFERRGNDLYSNQPISVLDLIVGTKINFTSISGKSFEVIVPPRTQPFMQLKIAGQGMPVTGTDIYGDQILLLKPFMPDNISAEIVRTINETKQN